MNNRIVKNASWIIGCKIAQSLINLIIGMISARYLGPSNYGLISYAGSIVAFVVPIMQLGLTKTLVLELLERPEEEGTVLGTALVMNVISGLACMLGVYGFLAVSDAGEPMTILVGVLYSISLLFQATEIIQYWFQAKLMSKYPSIASFAAYLIVAGYKVFLLVTGKGVIWFAVSNSIDYLFISAFLILAYYKLGNGGFRVSFRIGKAMLHRSKHYIVSAMMVTIFQQTDRIMLKLMLNESETGFYSAAVTCIGVTGFVFAAIIDSFRPVILESKKKQDANYEKQLVTLYSVITYLSLAQCVGMTLLAKPMVLILYGQQYMPSILVLQIAVWYITFSYYGSVRNIWILAEEKQRYLWMINLSGALANVVINALLIPSFGAIGAAVASLITQVFSNVLVGFIIRPIRYNNVLILKGLDLKPMLGYGKQFFRSLKTKNGKK